MNLWVRWACPLFWNPTKEKKLKQKSCMIFYSERERQWKEFSERNWRGDSWIQEWRAGRGCWSFCAFSPGWGQGTQGIRWDLVWREETGWSGLWFLHYLSLRPFPWCQPHLTWCSHSILISTSEIEIIIALSRVRKLKLKEVRLLAQGHIAEEKRRPDFTPGLFSGVWGRAGEGCLRLLGVSLSWEGCQGMSPCCCTYLPCFCTAWCQNRWPEAFFHPRCPERWHGEISSWLTRTHLSAASSCCTPWRPPLWWYSVAAAPGWETGLRWALLGAASLQALADLGSQRVWQWECWVPGVGARW